MSDKAPIIVWIRRDFRLADHPVLHAACQSGRPVIPVFVLDDLVAGLGAAPQWRLGLALDHFGDRLRARGSRLILRRGPALETLLALLRETGAADIWWLRAYDPDAVARDTAVKAALKAAGIGAKSFAGHVLAEPWEVQTGAGGAYRVFTPFWKAMRQRGIGAPLPEPADLAPPARWPRSDRLADWHLGRAMQRGAELVRRYQRVGEGAARARLDQFAAGAMQSYGQRRDFLAEDATSGLSENLSLGEISPRQCWQAGLAAMEQGVTGADPFLRQLGWRDFAYHLVYHTPQLVHGNWRPEWDGFPWSADAGHPYARAWRMGRTGIPVVDAGLREMYVTGRMHNRARMIVASYLTKHLMTHWRVGRDWFETCLTDWDPACNALGWQWVAGSGPDAAPYFRVFNPNTQATRFDPDGAYTRRWVAEGQKRPGAEALAYFDAVPRSWRLGPDQPYPEPVVGLAEGRAQALEAYRTRQF